MLFFFITPTSFPVIIKNKFGNIYILKVKVKNDVQDKLEDLKYFITLTFPGKLNWANIYRDVLNHVFF